MWTSEEAVSTMVYDGYSRVETGRHMHNCTCQLLVEKVEYSSFEYLIRVTGRWMTNGKFERIDDDGNYVVNVSTICVGSLLASRP